MKKEEKEAFANRTVLPVSVDDLTTGKELRKLTGPNLFQLIPSFFDARLPAKQRSSIVTSKQWQEYLDELHCSVCGKKGGKCKCKPENLVRE